MKEGRFPRGTPLEPLFALVDEFSLEDQVHPDRAFELKLSLEELFTNCVKYNTGTREEILVRLETKGTYACLTIQDFGVDEFDVTRAPKPDLAKLLESRKTGGLGLALVREMADEFRYRHDDRTCTIKIMIVKGS